MTAPSYDDLYQLGRAEMLLKRPDLFLAPGDVSDFLVAAAAAMADKCIQYGAAEFRKTFIDGAEGDDLTALVSDHFAIERQVATASQVSLTFTRPSAGGGEPAGTLAAGFTVSTEPDQNGERVEFTLDSAVSWALAEVGTKVVSATATEVGREGNVAAASITNLVDAPFDSSITVTNVAAAGGGNNEETDDALRERVRAAPFAQRRGTLAALEFGALTIASVRIATAIESSTGAVTLYVADETGVSTAEMVSDVVAEIENWRAAGTVVTVLGGSLLSQNVDYSLTVRAGTNVTALEPLISAAITARLERLPVGDGTATSDGVLRREVLQSAILCVAPESIFGATIVTPAADVVPAAGQVIRAGTITRV